VSFNVVVIDYGMGNLKSVQRGLEKVGANVIISSQADEIVNADRLLLPGVGAFKEGMTELTKQGVIEAIHTFVNSGKPLLGICLGMQMFLDSSEEHGGYTGLGLIPGHVQAIPQFENEKLQRKIPHIGWTNLIAHGEYSGWSNTCLSQVQPDDYFYFVHSFMAKPSDNKHYLAVSHYEGLEITAAINKENVTGLQFHPEKSGEAGLKILKSFVEST
jgi:imidazole glycerol-phosphate synthase subunit HisH